jgi:plastocyanin
VRRSRALAFVVASLVALSGCGSVPFLGSGGTTRRVLVDYKHDEFGASFLNYFPAKITVRPGDTVEFRQQWSGEPHTVTMGTLVDTLGKPYWELLDPLRAGEDVDVPENAPDAPGFKQLPSLLDASSDFEDVVQAAAQPCFRDTWVPDVRDVDEPCPKVEQPAFNGRQAYYSSGFIPFEGEGSNRFTVPIADDTLSGTYHFYCNYHGVAMSGAIEVVEGGSVPDQTEVTRDALGEAERLVDDLAEVLTRQRAGGDKAPLPVVGGRPGDGGIFTAFHNEFVPSTIEALVGEPVTWSFYGGHTLSFNVPKYFPVFTVREDGFVSFNPAAFKPVDWPGRPEQEGVPRAVHVDAGEWDGEGGLHSTGWDFGGGSNYDDGGFDTFTITFTRAGDYPFACLLHPSMVGRVVVR